MTKDRKSSYNSEGKEHFHKKHHKGNRRKGKKGFKWEKEESFKELLGFEGASPFDHESGYNLNELDLVHFNKKAGRKRSHHKNHTFSTAQHIQANNRFILKPNREQDYFYATYDPDYTVEWDDIFMVHAKRNADYICPICREEKMVVPTISK